MTTDTERDDLSEYWRKRRMAPDIKRDELLKAMEIGVRVIAEEAYMKRITLPGLKVVCGDLSLDSPGWYAARSAMGIPDSPLNFAILVACVPPKRGKALIGLMPHNEGVRGATMYAEVFQEEDGSFLPRGDDGVGAATVLHRNLETDKDLYPEDTADPFLATLLHTAVTNVSKDMKRKKVKDAD